MNKALIIRRTVRSVPPEKNTKIYGPIFGS
jgi:hypothetical protein